MVRVRVLGIALDAAMAHIVLLKPVIADPDDTRVLPIWVGAQEATSIALAIAGEKSPRPLTHDLTKTLLDTVGAILERVEVTRIEDGTFYAEITLRTPTGTTVLDARPSDSVALAVRADAPIWVADEVLAEAGIPAGMVQLVDGDENLDEENLDEEKLDEEKLDEFKRFLEDVDPEDFQG